MAKRKKFDKAPRSIRRAFPQVTSVVDADGSVEVHVGKKDCDTAEPLNSRECALARAAKREFKVDAAVIGISTSYLIKGTKAIRFNTPPSVAREIVSFDRHSDFQPGTYKLHPKPPTMRLGHRPGGKKKPGKKHGAKRTHHHTAKIRTFLGPR